ncbi:MAG: JAB domain-containing protein, partial [bacterium]|nr:JAB domain-containing protein [bacterium]
IEGESVFSSEIDAINYLKKLFPSAKAKLESIKAEDGKVKVVPKIEKEKAEVTPREPIKPTGTKKTIYLPDDTPIEISYDAIDSESLVVSHDTYLKINPAFPKELQPRDRGRKAMVLQVSEIAQKLNPERLGDSTGVGSGAPVIGKDGVVESGNGRVIAIRKAYEKDIGKTYKQWLIDNAEIFGLNPDQIKTIDKPILVRVRETEVDRADFVKKANQDEVARMSPVETAKSDADRLTEDDIALFTPSEEGDITAASNRAFINKFIKNLGTAESTGFLTKEGRYTKQLIDRITAAIFYKAYQNDYLITMMAEEADTNIKNILNALTVAAPEYVKTRALGKSFGDTAIIDHIAGAAQIISGARNLKQGVEQFFQQMSMFEQVPEYTKEITLFIDKNKLSAKRQGKFFKGIAKRINNILAENNSIALPGMKHRNVNIGEIIDDVIQQVEVKYEDKQRGFFAPGIEGGVEGSKRIGYRRAEAGLAGTGRGEVSEAKGGVNYTKKDIQTEFPEIISDRAGSYKSGVTTIVAAQDAAAFAHLNLSKYAQEHLAILILDENYKIISVHRYSIGTAISSYATPSIIAGHALNTSEASSIIIVHNHPSGTSELSDADVQIFRAIENTLKGTKIKINDLIAIGIDKYSSYANGGDEQILPEVKARYEVPLVERVFKTKGKNLYRIAFPQEVHGFGKDNLPEGGLILLNGVNDVVGTLPIKDYSLLREGASEAILKQIDATNAIAIIAYNPGVNISTLAKTNLKKFANATQLSLLDIVDKKGSFLEYGLMPVSQDTAFYATKQSIPESDITISQARDLFKPRHSGLTQDGNVWVKLRGGYGFQVKSVQSITEDKIAFEIGRGRMKTDGELIAGKFENDTIEIV